MGVDHVKEVEANKNVMDASVINRILGNNKKKKPLPAKRPAKVLLPPCLTYISNSSRTFLKVPGSYNINKIFPKPRTQTISKCSCGAVAKYKKPGTLSPYCSLPCYRKLGN